MLLPLAAAITTSTLPSYHVNCATSVIDALKTRTGTGRPLDLLNDFHDEPTGLCSEGVWHNSMLGLGQVLASRRLRDEDPERASSYLTEAQKLGDSLYALSFDGTFLP